MFPDKALRHILRKGAPVHAAQRIVAEDADPAAALGDIEAGAGLLIPEAAAQGGGGLIRLLTPEQGVLLTAQEAGDAGEGIPAGPGPAHDIHGRHGDHGAARGRGILRPPAGRVTVAQGIVLSGVIDTVAFQQAVAIGIPGAPKPRVELHQAGAERVQPCGIPAEKIIQLHRGSGEAEALHLVELRLQAAADAFNGAGEPAVLPLEEHEKLSVVPGGLRVAQGIHFPAHGLGLQPDLSIAAALHEDALSGKIPEIAAAFILQIPQQVLQAGRSELLMKRNMRKQNDPSGSFDVVPILQRGGEKEKKRKF